MKIGSIDFGDRPVFLAPMEDVTDIGFRLLCKRFGAAMVYTEFVSAEALIRDVKSTISKLTISDTERPVGIQIYGRDIEARWLVRVLGLVCFRISPRCWKSHRRWSMP